MVNYPHKKNKNANVINTSRRGMSLEKELDASNKYYLAKGIANIHKKPTPIQIVKVDYPKRSAAKIVEAYFKTPSTTDYNGIYKGYHIDFEAKESANKEKFILKNIHEHQFSHLQSVLKHGGIAFFIIRFTALNETFVVPADIIINIHLQGQKTISYDIIYKEGYLLQQGYQPVLDYLKIIDLLINKIEVNK